MPSIFSRSKPPPSVRPIISQPVPYGPAAVNDYRHERLLMQLPRTPSPPPPSPPPKPTVTGSSTKKNHRTTTVNQVIDLYTPVATQPYRRPSSERSGSIYEDENVSETSLTSAEGYRYAYNMPTSNSYPTRSNSSRPVHSSPVAASGPSNFAMMQSHTSRPVNPHIITLARALYFAEMAALPAFEPQPVQTRTDTRMQGRWLQLGTRRGVAARKLYKEVTEERAQAEKARVQAEKAELKVRRKMMKDAMKAERRK